MRIGILTCHSVLNYGANLQLFATAKSLEALGHSVFSFDNGGSESNACRAFVEKHIALSEPCLTDEDYRRETVRLELDLILVGSDAVLWFIPYANSGLGVYPNPFWLRWARDLPVRKAMISGSCMGVMFPKIKRQLRNELRDDLLAFDYISVRDRWTMSFLSYLGIKGADLVFDPTSCLPGLTESTMVPLPGGLESGKYVLFTFSGQLEADEWLAKAAPSIHQQGLKTVFIPHPDRVFDLDHVDVSFPEVLDPFDWLSVLCHAAGYAGERFHPIVLSAFYGVPFLACDYYSKAGLHALLSRRSKTRDFCKRLGVLDRMLPSDKFFSRVDPCRVMDRLQRHQMADVSTCRHLFQDALLRAVGQKGE